MSIIAAVIVVGYVDGYKTKFKRRLEYLNEALIMIVLYFMICLSPFVPQIEARIIMGYICCGFISLYVALNLLLIAKQTIPLVIYQFRTWYLKREMKYSRKKKMDNRLSGIAIR